MTYVFAIPYQPTSLNVWRHWHWSKQAKHREAFQSDVMALLREKGNVCPRPLRTPVTLRAVVVATTARRRDGDNLSIPLWKDLQDVLVTCGYLPDDTHDLVRTESPRVIVGAKEMTIVTIEEGGSE